MQIKRTLVIIAFIVTLIPSAFADEVRSKCPPVELRNNIFDASALVKNSRIAIEKGEEVDPIVLSIYRQNGDGCVREEFARYSIEGSAPTVESLFFLKMHGRANVFAIVSWTINNRGEGTYGKLYQVYAYQIEGNGSLSENKRVTENNSMTGIDGYDSGQRSRFQYKTAADVKKFWRTELK